REEHLNSGLPCSNLFSEDAQDLSSSVRGIWSARIAEPKPPKNSASQVFQFKSTCADRARRGPGVQLTPRKAWACPYTRSPQQFSTHHPRGALPSDTCL